MPWQSNTMNDKRREFAMKALEGGQDFSALCRQFSISRKTGYKWKQRALQEGVHGLREHSRRPRGSTSRVEEDVICALIRLKMLHPHWGAKKLLVILKREGMHPPSLSTGHRILMKAGLVAKRRRRTKPVPGRLHATIPPKAPNDVWTVDFKGWWLLRHKQRCEPLTVRDAFSRYLLSVHVPEAATGAAVRAEFERLFQLYGLPNVIKSDNGSPFASSQSVLGLSRLSAWWVVLGIELDRSRPAHPQDNGAHERMHLDLEREVAQTVQDDRRLQQAACDLWSREFNHVRPHEALGDRCPGEVYRKSARPYPGTVQLDYGAGFLVRKVSANGLVCYRRTNVFVSSALAGLYVGLRRGDASTFEVWLNYLFLGAINFQTSSFLGAPSRPSEAARLTA
jgi:putative transposase